MAQGRVNGLAVLLFQMATDGLRIDPTWVIGMLMSAIGALVSGIVVMWRQSLAENKRKDELIDRLLRQAGRAADVTDRTVSLAEKRQGRTPPP